MTIQIMQAANEKSPRHWEWSVWLDSSKVELDSIQSVTYQLHSTFKKPIREIYERESGFRIDSSGWGQFMIYILIKYHDGHEIRRQHWLKFINDAPSKEIEAIYGDELKGNAPTAFLSYSVADAVAAMTVRKKLENKGVSVLDVSSIGVGENLSDGIVSMINKSDFGISIVSDVSSEWVNQDVLQMKQNNLPVFQVNSGGTPSSLNLDLNLESIDPPEKTGFSNLIINSFNIDKN